MVQLIYQDQASKLFEKKFRRRRCKFICNLYKIWHRRSVWAGWSLFNRRSQTNCISIKQFTSKTTKTRLFNSNGLHNALILTLEFPSKANVAEITCLLLIFSSYVRWCLKSLIMWHPPDTISIRILSLKRAEKYIRTVKIVFFLKQKQQQNAK